MSVEVSNESGNTVDEQALVRVARHVLDRLGVSPLAELSVHLVDPAEMERLHVRYLGEPGPTDVLAFPMDELDLRGSRGVGHDGGGREGRADRPGSDDPHGPGGRMLGDVVLCPPVAERQAGEAGQAGHGTQEELELLCTHGVLHLLGYDHAEPDEHAQMFGLQGELLRSWREARTGSA